MLTDPKLRSQVDALWDKFWTGGLANPLDAIEQFSYLLFLSKHRPEGFFQATRFIRTNLRDGVLAGVVARVESLRGRMGESERQVEGLFESLLALSFGE